MQDGSVRSPPQMAVRTPSKAEAGQPPDLPSLLYNERIVYIGMPLVQQVTELLIAELMYFNQVKPEDEVTLYINSLGAQQQKQQIAFESEALAVLDTMNYIEPDIRTLCIAQSMGNATLLLAGGTPGKRAAMPNAKIQTAPPRLNRGFGTSVDMQIRAKEMEYVASQQIDLLAEFTGQPRETIEEEFSRDRYYSPESAVEFGLIDEVMQIDSDKVVVSNFWENALYKFTKDHEKRDERLKKYEELGREEVERANKGMAEYGLLEERESRGPPRN